MVDNNATISSKFALDPIVMLAISILVCMRTNNLSALHPA
ncbi:hypothetical protein FHR94_001031 [Halomonas cerina]|uniref:Uncharacterized protein n=1 Tax=Halomonas cerina TaxID=447424 RepID=A0A839VAS7_9GAMM|nr:hypothetical protein [Halomonas cerina]